MECKCNTCGRKEETIILWNKCEQCQKIDQQAVIVAAQAERIAKLEKALDNALQTLHITNNHGKAYKGCEVCKKFGYSLLKGAS